MNSLNFKNIAQQNIALKILYICKKSQRFSRNLIEENHLGPSRFVSLEFKFYYLKSKSDSNLFLKRNLTNF